MLFVPVLPEGAIDYLRMMPVSCVMPIKAGHGQMVLFVSMLKALASYCQNLIPIAVYLVGVLWLSDLYGFVGQLPPVLMSNGRSILPINLWGYRPVIAGKQW